MSVAAADMVLDPNYEGPHGADAEYFARGVRPVIGGGTPCRVMRGGQEAGLDIGGLSARPLTDQVILKVRVKQIATPTEGGYFHIEEAEQFFRIMGAPERMDRARREWTCQAVPEDIPAS
ncbi:head-tail joining protein [Hyphomonas pacifica]|uniref:Uncharacterized protein n=1 Tax=Hyphomonas pacifica TaxID=1280941 RepID=A0A8B2PJ87_9PROT|nr:hypothetical protein [Hyphomonas pacifica]RAN30637.1 hypothetical protein HY3_05665 [Hyphomonas pacifica]